MIMIFVSIVIIITISGVGEMFSSCESSSFVSLFTGISLVFNVCVHSLLFRMLLEYIGSFAVDVGFGSRCLCFADLLRTLRSTRNPLVGTVLVLGPSVFSTSIGSPDSLSPLLKELREKEHLGTFKRP